MIHGFTDKLVYNAHILFLGLGFDCLVNLASLKVTNISNLEVEKITGPDDWESETYRNARRNRSAVESLMFTIKDGFEFGELGRRGIDAVRDELTEKVLAYNCCRIILLKQRREKRRREEMRRAA